MLTERLKHLRISKNLKQRDIADAIHTSDRQYRRYESGENEPTASVLISIADYYDVTIDYLVGRSDDPTRH